MGIPGEQLNEWSCCFSPIEKPPSNRSYLMGPSASFLLPNHRRICKILLSRYRYRNNGSTFAAYAIAHTPPKKSQPYEGDRCDCTCKFFLDSFLGRFFCFNWLVIVFVIVCDRIPLSIILSVDWKIVIYVVLRD